MTAREQVRLLDAVGRRILEELQRDARLSYAELGRRVHLSTPAVAERVRRMEEAGIITGYHAAVNPAALGLPIRAILRVRARPRRYEQVRRAGTPVPRGLRDHDLT